MKKPKQPAAPLLDDLVGGRLTPEDNRRLEQAKDVLRELVEKAMPEDSTFEDYERAVLEITNEVARQQLERKLQTIADGHAPDLRIEHNQDWHGWRGETGLEYRQHLPGVVTYHSLVGPLQVRRYTYRERARNGSIYVALELDAGLMERMTPALACYVAFGFAHLPVRHVEKMLLMSGRRPPSRSTIDRSARDLGAYAIAANDEIEPLVRASETVPADAHAISLGLDRTAVLMRNRDTGLPGEYVHRDLRRSRPRRRTPAATLEGVSWRMDYVATVAFVNSDGERIASRQYRLPSDQEPIHVADRMMADVRQALKQKPSLKIAIVQDGAPELWVVLRERLRSTLGINAWHEVLDWFHAAERLSKCSELCVEDPRRRHALRESWKQTLLEDANGPSSFIAALGRQTAKPNLCAESREALQGHLNYFTERRMQLRYRATRRKGLPIGSGVTEGACNSLVGARAKRSGQHWTRRGLAAALHLRAIEQSDRFEPYWNRFTSRYRAVSMSPI